ncbi:hypothetical protein AB0H82_10710 [Streptomyces sp. NPDC050732]|uniref:hypothetical protein n=1 Tax=Streptomyces sp. NPDC050732 TaxID=3154632 RepID=UPI00343B0DDA
MIRWRPGHGRLRSFTYALLLAVVFLIVNAQVAYAAEGGGDMLAPLNVDSSEGVPINGYELSAHGGSIFSLKTNAYAFLMNGLFTLLRLLVGLACWAIEFALRFPLIKVLADPAQQISDTYNDIVVDTLGLKGLLLAWAFIFGGILLVRGKAGKGLGEIALTLLIAAFAASAFIRPDYLLGQDGPLAQSQQAAGEVAQATVASHDWGGKLASGNAGPCGAGLWGQALEKCHQIQEERPYSASEVAKPIQDSLSNVLVVKGYMLVQYGRVLDPGKKAERQAYALHLKWVSGGYKPGSREHAEQDQKADDACSGIKGPAKKYCKAGHLNNQRPDADKDLPKLTLGNQLLEAASPVLSEQDQQFAAFLAELKKAGPVGKACARYAQEPTGWRAAGVLLLFCSALLICAIALSGAFVLVGVQAADAAAAAVGGVALVWAMLPGPNRQAVWKWLALLGVSVAAMFAVCMFLPAYGIGIDIMLTDGPQMPAERLLALNGLALAALAFHRRLLQAITSAGHRLSLRMRYAKIGGTHLPGDSSEIGAALAVHGSGQGAGSGFGLRTLGSGYSQLGTRQRLMRSLAAMTDGTGMPLDTGRLLADAGAEASRGLAPLALAATGARVGTRGAWWLAVGRHPDDQRLEKMRKPTGAEDIDAGAVPPGAAATAAAGRPGGHGRHGPPDRYRDQDGLIADQRSGAVLHDQHSDRTLLSTRAHNKLVRLRGYRLLNRAGRIAYGATYALPANTRRGRARASQYTQDARQQLEVWRNTVREDGRAWRGRGRQADDSTTASGPAAGSRRLPPPSPGGPTAPPPVPPRPPAAPPGSVRSSVSPSPDTGQAAGQPWWAAGQARLPGPQRTESSPTVLGSSPSSREEARRRFEELRRRSVQGDQDSSPRLDVAGADADREGGEP